MRKILLAVLGVAVWGHCFAVREVVISEVAWMGTEFSYNDEWIELQNTTISPIDLTGWTLDSTDGTPSISLAGTIAAEGFFLLERTDDTTTSVDADQIYAGGMGNTGEELILKNSAGTEIDRTPAGAWPAGDNVSKKTMERADGSADGSLATSWQSFLSDTGEATDAGGNQIFGTPGAASSSASPPGRQFVSAPATGQITEICPVAIGTDAEWFEFTLTAEGAVDVTDFQISNGTSTKSFSEGVLSLGSGGTQITGTALADADGIVRPDPSSEAETVDLPAGHLLFLPEEENEPMYFFFSPSLVSLTDGGGSLELFNDSNESLDQISFPDTKSGTSGGDPYTEIWNRHPSKAGIFWPRISSQTLPTHTRGLPNAEPPTFPDDIELLISEFSPDRGTPQEAVDFLELLVFSSADDPANLKNVEIKHNGTTVITVPNDFFVSSGDRIVIKFSGIETAISSSSGVHTIGSSVDNLSSGSGTVEVILFAGTSWEPAPASGADPIEDFVCWKDTDLSQTESDRLAKNRPQNWSGDCVEISNLLPNEARARRELTPDTDSAADFFRHFLGSPGFPNLSPNPANSPPEPRIKVQGSQRVHETSLNFTGFDASDPAETTSDPDGASDLASFQWTIDGKSCGDYSTNFWEWRQTRIGGRSCIEESANPNPDRVYFNFDAQELFDVTLEVTDFSGATASVTVPMTRDPFQVGGSAPAAFDASLRRWIKKELRPKTASQKVVRSRPPDIPDFSAGEDFFDDFLAMADLAKLSIQLRFQNKLPPHQPRRVSPPSKLEALPPQFPHFPKTVPALSDRRKFSLRQRQRIRKNIGLIFTLPAARG